MTEIWSKIELKSDNNNKNYCTTCVHREILDFENGILRNSVGLDTKYDPNMIQIYITKSKHDITFKVKLVKSVSRLSFTWVLKTWSNVWLKYDHKYNQNITEVKHMTSILHTRKHCFINNVLQRQIWPLIYENTKTGHKMDDKIGPK